MRCSTWVVARRHANHGDTGLDRVFIGSCTNSRIEDLREAAAVVRGRRVKDSLLQAMVVPGSGEVKAQAEEEGLDQVSLRKRGMEWREPGCSMCLAMNADKLGRGEHCASTSNRNFERPAGLWWPHPPGQPGDGRCGSDWRATSLTCVSSEEVKS